MKFLFMFFMFCIFNVVAEEQFDYVFSAGQINLLEDETIKNSWTEVVKYKKNREDLNNNLNEIFGENLILSKNIEIYQDQVKLIQNVISDQHDLKNIHNENLNLKTSLYEEMSSVLKNNLEDLKIKNNEEEELKKQLENIQTEFEKINQIETIESQPNINLIKKNLSGQLASISNLLENINNEKIEILNNLVELKNQLNNLQLEIDNDFKYFKNLEINIGHINQSYLDQLNKLSILNDEAEKYRNKINDLNKLLEAEDVLYNKSMNSLADILDSLKQHLYNLENEAKFKAIDISTIDANKFFEKNKLEISKIIARNKAIRDIIYSKQNSELVITDYLTDDFFQYSESSEINTFLDSLSNIEKSIFGTTFKLNYKFNYKQKLRNLFIESLPELISEFYSSEVLKIKEYVEKERIVFIHALFNFKNIEELNFDKIILINDFKITKNLEELMLKLNDRFSKISILSTENIDHARINNIKNIITDKELDIIVDSKLNFIN